MCAGLKLPPTTTQHHPHGPPVVVEGERASYVANMGIEYEYMRVANELEAEIKAGRLKPEARLPNERDLGAQYGVSHATARRAVKELRERGLVVTLANKGTYVLPQS